MSISVDKRPHKITHMILEGLLKVAVIFTGVRFLQCFVLFPLEPGCVQAIKKFE